MTRTIVESKTKTAIIGFDQPFAVIGERINPTGRKKLALELEAGDFSTVEADAIAQVLAGATILDINMELFANITGMGSTKARSGKEMEAIRAANFLTNNDPNGSEWIRTNKDPNAAKGAGRVREGGRRRRG